MCIYIYKYISYIYINVCVFAYVEEALCVASFLDFVCGFHNQFLGHHPQSTPKISSGNEMFYHGIYYNVRPPSDVCWLRFTPVTIVISTINQSYWSYLHQLSYLGGLTLY